MEVGLRRNTYLTGSNILPPIGMFLFIGDWPGVAVACVSSTIVLTPSLGADLGCAAAQ